MSDVALVGFYVEEQKVLAAKAARFNALLLGHCPHGFTRSYLGVKSHINASLPMVPSTLDIAHAIFHLGEMNALLKVYSEYTVRIFTVSNAYPQKSFLGREAVILSTREIMGCLTEIVIAVKDKVHAPEPGVIPSGATCKQDPRWIVYKHNGAWVLSSH